MKIDYALLLLKPSGFTGGPCITERYKIMIYWHFVKNETEINEHALKMQYISMLPKYKNEF